MALIKTAKEIETLREGGKILADILAILTRAVRPGISTWDLEELARAEIKKAGAEPAFLGYQSSPEDPPYPTALCASVDDELVHCVPDKKKILREGEIIGLDLGIKLGGLYTDSAVTVPVGKVSTEAQRLMAVTKEAMEAGIAQVKPGATIGDISSAVEAVAKREKLGVVRDLVGHGVGHAVHEPPRVPNYGKAGTLEKLQAGMVIAIEPMFTLGDWRIRFLPDSHNIVTADSSLSAHFEHTVAVTADGFAILTKK